MKTLQFRNSINRSPLPIGFILFAVLLACFALPPAARALLPPPAPDGGYVNGNTAEGTNALFSLTSGTVNTANGGNALYSNTTGGANTASGASALYYNTTGYSNTATGYEALQNNTSGIHNTANGVLALFSNTTGDSNTATGVYALSSNTTANNNTADGFQALASNTTGTQNTATGAFALANNDTANNNTANGFQALLNNTTGGGNTANGFNALANNRTGNNNTANGNQALLENTQGTQNTATGAFALFLNTTANNNTADGVNALLSNTTGAQNTAAGSGALRNNTTANNNTADGFQALFQNITGAGNTAIGVHALLNNKGSSNIGLGLSAGVNLTIGSNNIDIGSFGAAGESNTIRIGSAQVRTFIKGISGAVVSGAAVVVNAGGQLGVAASSERFKTEIKPMDKASEVILALKPVTFRYKKEIDPERLPQFGLVAEEVEKANPALVLRDADGKPFSVRYEAVNAMLLNEFLKEHKAFLEEQHKMQELEATVAQQRRDFDMTITGLKKEMESVVAHAKEQDSKIQRVSTQIEVNKPIARMVSTNP